MPPDFGFAANDPSVRRATELLETLAQLGEGETLRRIFPRLPHADAELHYFGQELFLKAEALGALSDSAYQEALANDMRYARAEGLDRVLAEHQLDKVEARRARHAAGCDADAVARDDWR